MNWPTSQDYNEAIQNAASSMSDPDLKKGEAVANAMGLPVPRSGNFADVYQFKGGDGKMWAVKCFTRHVEGLQERYTKIDAYLSKAQFPFTVGFKYLAEGLRIQGKWFPLLKMEWVEGFTLNEFVRQNADKPKYLHGLMQMWAKLTGMLRDANIAHADLQHGNVLLVPGNTPATLGLKLIDYDGMWVPPLADNHSGEIGHPNFQHPLRLKDRLFNAEVDRFPHLVIAAALRATLVGGKAIWEKYDNGDNLLFREQDLRDAGNAKIFKALWELNDPVLCTLVGHIALSSKQPLRKTPWLDDILLEEKGPRLSPEEEKQAEALWGARAPVQAVESKTGSTIREEFNDFANLGVDDEDLGGNYKEVKGKKSGTRKLPPKKGQKRAEVKKSKMPMFIGAGVLALALIGGLVAMMSGGKKDARPQQVVNDDKEPEKPKPNETAKIKTGPKDTIPAKDPINDVENPSKGGAEPPKEVKPAEEVGKANTTVRTFTGLAVKKPVAGLAVVPKTRDYLFFEENEPNLYWVREQANGAVKVGQHDQPIRAVACSLDGRKAVTGGDDGKLRVWSFGSQRNISSSHILQEHTLPLVACAVSPDGARAVSVGKDDLLCEWDIKEGKLIGKFKIPTSTAVAFLPDGKKVLLGTQNESAGIWDLEKQERVKELPGHTGAVRTVCVDTTGLRGVTGGDDGIIRYWDLGAGAIVNKFDWDKEGINGLAISPNGRVLASASPKGRTFWDLGDGRFLNSVSGKFRSQCIAFFDDGQSTVVGAANDGGGLLTVFRPNLPAEAEVAKTPDLPTTTHSAFYIVVSHTEQMLETFIGYNSKPIRFSPDGKLLCIVRRGRVTIVEASSGKTLSTVDSGSLILNVCFGIDDMVYLVNQDQFQAWDWKQNKLVHSAPSKVLDNAPILDIQPMKEPGKLLLSVGRYKLSIWDAVNWKMLDDAMSVPGNSGVRTPCAVYGVSFSDDRSRALVNSSKGYWVWDVQKKDAERLLLENYPSSQLRDCVLSPNGKWVLGIAEGTDANSPQPLFIWDAQNGKRLAALENMRAGIRIAGFLSAGNHCILFSDREPRRLVVDVPQGKIVDFRPMQTREAVTFPSQNIIATLDGNLNGMICTVKIVDKPQPVVVTNPDPKTPSKGEVLTFAREAQIQTRPDARVGFSKDGKYLYHIADTVITVIETSTGNQLSGVTLASSVRDAAFGKGTQLFITAADGLFGLYDFQNSQFIHQYNTKESKTLPIRRIRPLPDGDRLVLETGSPSALMWDVSNWIPTGRFSTINTGIFDNSSIFPDGSRALARFRRKGYQLGIVNIGGKNEVALLAEGSFNSLTLSDVSPNGKWIVAHTNEDRGQFMIWEANTGKLLHTIADLKLQETMKGAGAGGGFTGNGNYFVCDDSGGRRLLVDLAKGTIAAESVLAQRSHSFAVSPAASMVATADQDGKLRLWNLSIDAKPIEIATSPDPKANPKGKKKKSDEKPEGLVKTSKPFTDFISAIVFSNDSQKIYAIGDSGTLFVFETATLEETAQHKILGGKVQQMLTSPKMTLPNGAIAPARLYLFDNEHKIRQIDAEKGTQLKEINLDKLTRGKMDPGRSHMTLAPDGNTLLVTDFSVKPLFWDTRKWEAGLAPALQRLNTPRTLEHVTFSHDSKIAAQYFIGRLSIWNYKSGQDIRAFDTLNVHRVELIPEASVVLVDEGGSKIRALNYNTGKELWNERLHGANRFVVYATIPKSPALVSAGNDGSIRVTEASSFNEAAKWLIDPGQSASLIAVSPDGKFAATFHLNPSLIRLWALPTVVAKKR